MQPSHPTAPAPVDDTIDLRAIVELLRRQLRLIIVSVAVVLALAVGYLATVTPVYTAEVLVLVDPAQRNLLDGEQAATTSAQSDNARIESEVGILRSPSMALSVIERADLVSDPEFGPSMGLRQRVLTAIGLGDDGPVSGDDLTKQMITRLQDATNVRRVGLTYLISVAVTAEDPERAARVANIMAQTYIQNQVAAKVAAQLAARDVLSAQIAAGREAVARSDRALDSFIEDNLGSIEAEAGNPRIAELRAQLDALRASQLRAEVTAEEARAALEAGNYGDLAARLGDAALADLAAERDALRRQLGQIASGTAEEIDLRAALSALEGTLEEQANARLGDLRGEVTRLGGQIGDFRGALREELLGIDLPSEALAQVFELQQEAQIARAQYQTLLSRLRDLEAQAGIQIADSRIVSEALAPINPSAPNRRLILALALVAGLGLGVGLAFLNEYYVGGITSAAQLRDLTGVPVATTVPLVSEKIDAGHSIADKVIREPLSPYAESIRRLRASIDQGFRKRGLLAGPAGRAGTVAAAPEAAASGRVILVTSAVPAEGKTTLALALARIYAISGKKTLLIDADLRKPSVHRQVGIQPEFGLLDYLLDYDSDDVAQPFFVREPETKLSLLLGAGRSNIPTDQVISSTAFDTIVEWAKRVYDVVVIDTSPLLPVVDARYIAHHADAVVLAVRYAATSQSDLRGAAASMMEAMRAEADIHGVLSHQQYRQEGYKYDGYYLAYGGPERGA